MTPNNQPNQLASSSTQTVAKPADRLPSNASNTPPSQPVSNSVPSQEASTTGNVPVNNAAMNWPAEQQATPYANETQPSQVTNAPSGSATDPNTPVQTSTPEMDMDAIVRAWRDYKSQQMTTQSAPANRYSQPAR
jgi:ABC-type glycerol-3-phosphate transport system substrate-binding protein